MWLWILAGLPATAGDASSHLPDMQRQHGWQTVAAVVQSADQGDISLSEVHARLQELGLEHLTMPVHSEIPAVQGVQYLHACGWNQGVACRLDLPPAERLSLAPVCSTKSGVVPDVSLTAVIDPPPTATTPGVAHISDLLPCWAAGGDRVILRDRPAPQSAGLNLTVEGLDASTAQDRLAPMAPGLATCAPGVAVVETGADGRLTVLKLERDDTLHPEGTACVQDVLGRLRLDGAAKIRITLPASSP